jgi:hypothetical protein
MDSELSIAVMWAEDGGSPHAGRLDVGGDGLRLDGGARGTHQTRDVRFRDIVSFRVDRSGPRRAVVIEIAGGGSLSFVAFERPGALHELAQRLQRSVSAGLA